jgi:hypothetical protein
MGGHEMIDTNTKQRARGTLEALQEKARVIQGFLDGKQIQQCWNNTWHDVEWPDFGDPYAAFRVKPDLIEGWVNVYPDFSSRLGVIWYTKKEADQNAAVDRVRVAHLREVEE